MKRDFGLGEAFLDHRPQQLVMLLAFAVDPRLMRELEPGAIVLQPPHRAVDLAGVAKHEADLVPQEQIDVAADHRAAGGEVHKLDDMLLLAMPQEGLFGREAMAIAAANVAAASFRARNDYSVEHVGLRAFRRLGTQQGLIGAGAEYPRPDTHYSTPRGTRSRYAVVTVTKLCTDPGERRRVKRMPVEDGGRWEGCPPPASL